MDVCKHMCTSTHIRTHIHTHTHTQHTHDLYAVHISYFPSEKVLPNDAKARRLFVTSGGLKKVRYYFDNFEIIRFNVYAHLAN